VSSADETAQTIAAPSVLTASEARPVVVGERYEILGMLGAGGMGNVYKARDLELDELVALKVLRPELVGAPGTLERFRREVKLARRVTHPNVARVFDIGERGGDRILTMEFVDGESLGALLAREKRLPVGRVVEIASAICAGLGAAHAAGVVHRDLKPDNVLLEKGGRVVLTDFGIARAVAADDAQNTLTAFVGTPAYMAPEQIEVGVPIDARTDLYALGAMLFELLTGERPWQGDTLLVVAAARLLHPPPDPRARRPDLPAGLAALVLRCMARHPADRYASAADVAGDLSSLTVPAISLAVPSIPMGGLRWGSPAAVPEGPLSQLPPPQTPSIPPTRRAVVAEPAPERGKRVAVLPFRNAGAPEHDYLADGLTEDLIDVLSMSPGLRVRSRGVVMRYRGSDRDAREIGRELDVQVVVDGTVRRAGAGVRVSARLISVDDGFQLWAKRFDRPEGELLMVSDDAARAVAEALTVGVSAPARKAELDPEAMDLYLRARAAYHGYFSNVSSLPLFEQALARAPDHPKILAGYAMARARFWRPDGGAAVAAREAAERAVALAPNLAEGHLALGAVRFQTGDEAGAVSPLFVALRLSPTNGEAHDLLGRILSETSMVDEARRHLTAALTLDPELLLARIALARQHELAGEHVEADRILRLQQGDTRLPLAGRFVVWRRDALRAAELAELIANRSEGLTPVLMVVKAFAEVVLHGTPPYAMFAAMSDPERITVRTRGFFAQLEAEAAGALGDREHALAAIERAASLGIFDVAWMDGCPPLAGLREEARFLGARATVAARAERVVEAYRAG
jgi:serine/threonine-protein kinase